MKRKKPQALLPQPITFGIDPRLESVKQLPGGDALYEMVKARAEEAAKELEEAVTGILAKHELPNDVLQIKAMGYEIMINVTPAATADGKLCREVMLFKELERVVVGE